MRCPYCRANDSRVVDSRELGGGDSIRRRRECTTCHRRFTTYERIEGAGLMVVKKDGRRQEFDPVKLRQKLRVALTKRPVGEEQIDAMLHRIEADLLSLGTAEVPSRAIGEAVLRELKQLDEVAYIRFASVYRQFADIEEFHREMEDLRERPAPHPLTRGARSGPDDGPKH
jgi:transcriptional repressor NrdR